MIKYILTLLLIAQSLMACALCTIYSPETKVSISVKSTDDTINKIEINWKLTEAFTNTLKNVYDINLNNNFDENEINELKKTLIVYLEPNNYLVHLSYGKRVNKNLSTKIDIDENSVKLFVKDNILHVSYAINKQFKIEDNKILYFNIIDKDNYFLISLDEKNISYDETIFKNSILDMNSITFTKKSSLEAKIVKEKTEEVVAQAQTKEQNYLDEYTLKLKETLLKIEKGDTFALFTLLLISFFYGVVHALGPGHGKALAFSYFLTKKSSFIKAFSISQATAFIHIIGALVLVLISVFLIESFLNNFVSNSIELITKLSAFFIMVLALFIFYKKLKDKSCSCHSCCSVHKKDEKSKKQDIFFVITAGIVPCPGTVVLFLYAFVLETYLAVFLASIFISLGMGLVIFLSSFLGMNVNKFSNNFHTTKNVLEYLSPIFIFILGALLFFNANLSI